MIVEFVKVDFASVKKDLPVNLAREQNVPINVMEITEFVYQMEPVPVHMDLVVYSYIYLYIYLYRR